MRKGEQSRAKLVSATAQLLQRQGYHATGLAEIVEKSAAPRGSLYFYFPGGKEALACEALQQSGAHWRGRLEEVVSSSADVGAAVNSACQAIAGWMEESGFELGCPLATVALEAGSTSESVRQVCVEHFAGWEHTLTRKLVAQGMDAAAASRTALFVLSTIEGAMLLSKIRRDTTPLLLSLIHI